MLFNSLAFARFLPIVMFLYGLINSRRRVYFLLIASCVFYSYFIPKYLLILFAVIGIDYWAGLAIEKAEGARRKRILLISVFANLAILFFFKYYNFFLDNFSPLFTLFGSSATEYALKFVLPIGLSFHVFQSLSYTIEVYRGRQKAESDLAVYSLYVLYFPQLVAGPIERPQNLLHQFKDLRDLNYDNCRAGIQLIATGLIKKCVIADNLTILVDKVYSHPTDWGGIATGIATLFFAFQIFCDFAGYSDIARGCSKIFGVDLMINFDKPYFARSISEFWRRWHISLSTWFKDYVYIPLGGSRGTLKRTCVNALIVFSLSGLWHGASWNFVIWGLFHGILIGYENVFKPKKSLIITFSLVLISWVFFRAKNFHDASYILFESVLHPFKGLENLPLGNVIDGFSLIAALVTFQILDERKFFWKRINAWPSRYRWALYIGVSVVFLLLGQFNNQQFIYFQF